MPCRPSKLRLLVLTQYCAGGDGVAVHAEAHRAAGLAPLGARVDEDLGQALGLGCLLDLLRAGHDQRAHAARDLAPAQDARGGFAGPRGGRWCSCR